MRNREFIRQWEILRTLDACRLGRTIHELAADTGVSTRTIRRDLAALGEAGFPVYCDEEGEATKRWKLDQRPFRGLEDNASRCSNSVPSTSVDRCSSAWRARRSATT
ncbi:MAG: HTH domain-containing protein [Acidobacteria bacterium]|nr:HTH domain-containing protein [Acidobacteriota bacterium]